MSKQIRLRFTTILVAISLAAALLGGNSASLASQQRRVIPSPSARNLALISATASVLKETSEIRELSIMRPVRSATQSRPQIERMIIKNMNEETTPSELHATEITWKKLGLTPPDYEYRQSLIKLLREQVAGYYEPRSQRFFIADWIDLDAQKPVMAHELTHALQDQHFNLRRFEKWPKGNSDAEMAAHALIEGDATLVMKLYVAHNPLGALSFLKFMKEGMAASQQLDRTPRALRESLLFPYIEGSEWARELYKRSGWLSISRAFTDLPKSTEQILHVEKYLANEQPVKVTLPDVKTLLGVGWKRVDYDVNGEWNYYLILDEFLKARADSKRAAAGWGGDRYAVYEGPKLGDVLLAQLSVWDTERDAREFFDAYVKRTLRRYPDAAEMSPALNSEQPLLSKTFRTAEGAVTIELRRSRVLILEGVPDRVDLKALFKSLWQQ